MTRERYSKQRVKPLLSSLTYCFPDKFLEQRCALIDFDKDPRPTSSYLIKIRSLFPLTAPDLHLPRLEGDRQRPDHKDDPHMNRNRDTLHSLQAPELFQHHWQGNPGFQTSQRSANTEVNAVTKRQVAIGITLDIKPIWIGELGRITVG